MSSQKTFQYSHFRKQYGGSSENYKYFCENVKKSETLYIAGGEEKGKSTVQTTE